MNRNEYITTVRGSAHLPGFISAIKECGRKGDPLQGKALHLEATETGFATNKCVSSALITMYSKCACMIDARAVFEAVSHPDVISWTTLILGYAENGESDVALDVFAAMDCRPDSFAFVAAIKACIGLVSRGDFHSCFCMEKGIAVHMHAKELGLDTCDLFVASNLVRMYSRLGKMEYAQCVFDSVVVRRNTVVWTSLLLGYVENGCGIIALELFTFMDSGFDSVVVVAALKALIHSACTQRFELEFLLEKGIEVHRLAKDKGVDSDSFVSSTLIGMYTKCGSLTIARVVFNGEANRNVVSWNTLILGYVEHGESRTALDLFRSMDVLPDAFTVCAALKACVNLASEREFCLEAVMSIHRQVKAFGFHDDVYVANTLIDMYIKLGSLLHAKATFSVITSRDVVSWNCLIMGCVEGGECLTALELFTFMDCQPNTVSFIAAFKACSGLAGERRLSWSFCVEKGMRIHRLVTEEDVVLSSSVVEFYCRYRCMAHARSVFESMSRRDVVVWNILIAGYVESGDSGEALKLFTRMDCQPNHSTYIAALRACGSVGALAAGKEIHDRILTAGLEQEQVVANTLVDFYGKCGCMSAAEDVFGKLESKDVVSWNALLAGYCALGDASKVFGVVKRMKRAGQEMDGITYLHILTTCNHAGMVDEGIQYFKFMVRCGSGIKLSFEHCKCMLDMLGRANRIKEEPNISWSRMI